MPTLYNADLKPLAAGVSTHSYDHATKLFLADNYRLTPKQTFLYYVCINVDKTVFQTLQTGGIGAAVNSLVGGGGVSSQSLIEQYEAGLMAKRVDLPKFTLGTKTLNAYNRKNVIQTHLSYDPITITFHDDAADVVTRFWNDYYTYYYRDSDYTTTEYQLRHKYSPRTRAKWGYSPRNFGTSPFLRNIQIFSLHNKRFTEYLLVNPFITNWRHGEHNSGGGSELMENTMSIAYESVKYRTGYVNAVDVNGFGILHYDNTDSPISTSVTNIYTEGGLISAVAGGATDLSRPDGVDTTSLINQIAGAAKFYNSVKNANFQSIAGTALGQIGAQVLSGAANSASNVFFPTPLDQPTTGVNYPIGGIVNPSPTLNNYPYAYPGSNPLVTAAGTAIGVVGSAVTQTSDIVSGAFRNVFGTQPNTSGSGVKIDPKTGQPVTGTFNSVIVDGNGEIISRFTSSGSLSGKYDPANPDLNLVSLQITKDENNNEVSVRTYADGTQVVNDASGKELANIPGTKETNPFNGSGGPLATVTYTDPTTGITYTPGSSSTSLITNTITGAAGSTAGLVVGSSVNNVLSKALGTSVIGRAVSTAASGVIGTLVGRAVNNALQPIINPITGQVTQVFNTVTGQIQNVIGSIGKTASDALKTTTGIVSDIITPNATGAIDFGSDVYVPADSVQPNNSTDVPLDIQPSPQIENVNVTPQQDWYGLNYD